MEEDMHSFLSTKSEATEELRGHLEKLKTMYGTAVKALDDLVGELDSYSQSTFGQLITEVSKHSALEELYKRITSEAEYLLHDLEDNLNSWEKKLTAYAQQQREGGIDENEDPRNAAFRELREETGVTSAEIVTEIIKI
ncbi:hypothetical protein ACS0TY_034375 [Phlomoides rotata]